MSDEVLARARAVVARMVAEREAGYLAAPGAWDEALAPAIELDAVPVLIRLAEATIDGHAAWDAGRKARYQGMADADYAAAYARGQDAKARADAALADLAALAPCLACRQVESWSASGGADDVDGIVRQVRARVSAAGRQGGGEVGT